ncbi:sensor histidine kinase [Terriglobus sp.]|uniref:sensor histidine kinase n=1 Tax=Terriglobus sp. TaxID=1889013 RepID=UPI003B002FEC
MPAVVISSLPVALDAIRTGDIGALVVAAETLGGGALAQLQQAMDAQPHWSDVPILLLMPAYAQASASARLEALLQYVPSATLVERPIRPATLLSLARAALKSRSRQYEVRSVIEQRDQTAAKLVESEKLAAVGRLAASISHEINNPLESITNLLYLAQQDPDLSPETRDYLETASSELIRAAHITQQSLRFHRQSTRPQRIGAADLLAPVLAIYAGRLANNHVQLHTTFRDNTEVVCREGEIRQVLSNLVSNAIDAMRLGGLLRIGSHRAVHPITGAKGVAILVSDTGHGMPPHVSQRIFEAFYSTKGNNGTGLGLWISADLVRKHGGSLQVRSRHTPTAPGTLTTPGTLFRLFLPCNLTAS